MAGRCPFLGLYLLRPAPLLLVTDPLSPPSPCPLGAPQHHHQAGEPIDEAELEAAACAMGYGAVKYADLRNSRLTNYKFSYDSMLDLKGNTAVYLLYAHARIAGIVRKSGRDIDALLAGGASLQLEHPKERELAMAIVKVGAGCCFLRGGVHRRHRGHSTAQHDGRRIGRTPKQRRVLGYCAVCMLHLLVLSDGWPTPHALGALHCPLCCSSLRPLRTCWLS